jgi:long-chain acyl-CoA synthetase
MYLTQGLHRALQLQPERIATIFRDRIRTYREFTDRVARLASGLRSVGMKAEDRVGMLALNSDRYLEYLQATWWGGGVVNPVNIRWSAPEIVYSLDDCDTGILIVDDFFLRMVEQIRATAKRTPVFIYAGEKETPAGMLSFEQLIAESAPIEDAGRGGNDLASIMYTGGTTGLPKGVMQSHLNLWASGMQRMPDAPVMPDSIALHAAPLFHTAAMARAVMQFDSGGTHVTIPMFDPTALLETIQRHRVNETLLVPTMLQAVLMHPEFDSYDISTLRRLTYGASPIAAAVLERALKQLPKVQFFHAYGLTEASPVISINPPKNHSEEAIASGLYRSVGRACQGVTVRIVDGEGCEVPRGTVGEIVARGANVMLGYWNRPEETRTTLRDGWLHTGDGAYMDRDGYIYIVDRMKDMIVSGGENVYSAEVENVIARHPAVAMCAVIGVPDERWGEAVHAIVVAKEDVELTEQTLTEHCRQFIAGYKCPKTFEFRTELPMSGAGKILKKDLRQPFWEGRARAVN